VVEKTVGSKEKNCWKVETIPQLKCGTLSTDWRSGREEGGKRHDQKTAESLLEVRLSGSRGVRTRAWGPWRKRSRGEEGPPSAACGGREKHVRIAAGLPMTKGGKQFKLKRKARHGGAVCRFLRQRGAKLGQRYGPQKNKGIDRDRIHRKKG